jgi:type I restriction enzyme M protein
MPKTPFVVFLDPRTCGIYKDGGTRYKTDPATGLRTDQVDNELLEHVTAYLNGGQPPGSAKVSLRQIFGRQVLVPTYYDDRYNEGIVRLLRDEKLDGIPLGELIDTGYILVRGGHGSPSNDQRSGHIPYVKVSDIRGLRININPTNLVSDKVAERFWRGADSGLQAWDLITPNRASSNIGEFAILLPGEEQVVLTKEVFVLRIINDTLFDPFYLLWALSLKAVRDQWRRIALMQTNREDCGSRYREILLPKPPDKAWATKVSKPFRTYFTTLANAKTAFVQDVQSSKYSHVANVISAIAPEADGDNSDEIDGADE